MPKYALIDCKPVPAKLEAELRAIKAEAGATLTSCLRTQGAVDFARGKGCTLSSQRELYDGFVKGLPGFNPANPPGRSTHERRSDGVAFAGPAGRILFYWQVGQDWGDGPHARAVVAAAGRRGWRATITYPSNPREQHHVNFRKEPILKAIPRTLKYGSRGPGVSRLRKRLHYVHRPHGGEPYYEPKPAGLSPFGRQLAKALKAFQADHGLPADGVFGPKTRAQLKVSVRRERKRRAKR